MGTQGPFNTYFEGILECTHAWCAGLVDAFQRGATKTGYRVHVECTDVAMHGQGPYATAQQCLGQYRRLRESKGWLSEKNERFFWGGMLNER